MANRLAIRAAIPECCDKLCSNLFARSLSSNSSASLAVGTVYLIVLLMILRYGEAGPPAVPPRQGQGPGQARAEDCRRRKSSG